MIQIFGCVTDPHVQAVTEHLNSLGHEFRILDAFNSESGGYRAEISSKLRLCLGAESYTPISPDVVWWRVKPPFFLANNSISEYYDQQFSFREWLAALEHISLLCTGAIWVNSRAANATASNKILQLEVAARYDLAIPATLVTDNAEQLLQFIASFEDKRCIHKTFMPYISPDMRQKYASFIDAGVAQEYREQIESCPSIYQEYIKPKFEVRATVIGETIFSVKICKKNKSEPDCRTEISHDIYEVWQMPETWARRVLDVHSHFALHYGAYDFIVDEYDRLVFLEVNPAGQWLWLEERLEFPVSRALAIHLIRLAHNV